MKISFLSLGLVILSATSYGAITPGQLCKPYGPTTICVGDPVLNSQQRGVVTSVDVAPPDVVIATSPTSRGDWIRPESSPALAKVGVCFQPPNASKICVGDSYKNPEGGIDHVMAFMLGENTDPENPYFLLRAKQGEVLKQNWTLVSTVLRRMKQQSSYKGAILRTTESNSVATESPPAKNGREAIIESAIAGLKNQGSPFVQCRDAFDALSLKIEITEFTVDRNSCSLKFTPSSRSFNPDVLVPGGSRDGFFRKEAGYSTVRCNVQYTYNCSVTRPYDGWQEVKPSGL
jgi:hypothetical protein